MLFQIHSELLVVMTICFSSIHTTAATYSMMTSLVPTPVASSSSLPPSAAPLSGTAATATIPLLTPSSSSNRLARLKCSTSMDGALPSSTPSNFYFSGNVRQYYIAAEQDSWNYAPSGWDNWLGVPLNASTRAYLAGYTTPNSLGLIWEKALYRGYTDATFSDRTEQAPTQGINGPTIRAEVGDMIEILFVNNLNDNYASMHSMGLSYSKTYEGSLYPNYMGSSAPYTPASGDALSPGECVVYKWLVDDGSAPEPGSPSHMWGYHSYVDIYNDLNAGLQGPTIVYNRGQMKATMAAHREFVVTFMNYDETLSFMSAINAAKFDVQPLGFPQSTVTPSLGNGYGNYSTWFPQIVNMESSSQLNRSQAPIFYSINGQVFANNYPFEMCQNDKALWYVQAYGSASHVFHMHGNGFVWSGNNYASISFNDGVRRVLQMTAWGVGSWQLICHVSNHLAYGMDANYLVYPTGSCPLSPLAAS